MLDPDTKRRIDTARDILLGKVPDEKGRLAKNFKGYDISPDLQEEAVNPPMGMASPICNMGMPCQIG